MTVAAKSWTCDNCAVNVQWAQPHQENAGFPDHWRVVDDELLCLSCRRDAAGEAGLIGIGAETPIAERVKLRSRARIEFEISRDPGRPNNKIASTCHTSAAVVKKARERMAEAVAL
jgi:hypothetical protein